MVHNSFLPVLLCLFIAVSSNGVLKLYVLKFQDTSCQLNEMSAQQCSYSIQIFYQYSVKGGVVKLMNRDLVDFKMAATELFFHKTDVDIQISLEMNFSRVEAKQEETNVTVSVIRHSSGTAPLYTHTFNFTLAKATLNPKIRYMRSRVSGDSLLEIGLQIVCSPGYGELGCMKCQNTTHCSKLCIPSTNYICNVTGKKECNHGYHGGNCDRYCVATERNTCTRDGHVTCSYPWIGVDCTTRSHCPVNQYGEVCSKHCVDKPGRYRCNLMGDRVCEGVFSGTNCSQCAPGYYGNNCSSYCDSRNTSRYTCDNLGNKVCQGNWTGKQCDECKAGHYGEACNIFCSPNSTKYRCTEFGYRICSGNWDGINCNQCRADYYGDSCKVYCRTKSKSYQKCDPKTGDKVCKDPNSDPDNCQKCKNGYFRRGDNAKTFECVLCEPGPRQTCDEDGYKCARSWWYGPHCNLTCVDEVGRYYCAATPNGFRKICMANFAGEACAECAKDYYGTNCSVKCSNEGRPERFRCTDEGELVCQDDFYGIDCNLFCAETDRYSCDADGKRICKGRWDEAFGCDTCSSGYYGNGCNISCVEDLRHVCHRNGSRSCRENFKETLFGCTECSFGYWGDDCDIYCVDDEWFYCDENGIYNLVDHNNHALGPYVKLGLIVSIAFVLNSVVVISLLKCCESGEANKEDGMFQRGTTLPVIRSS